MSGGDQHSRRLLASEVQSRPRGPLVRLSYEQRTGDCESRIPPCGKRRRRMAWHFRRYTFRLSISCAKRTAAQVGCGKSCGHGTFSRRSTRALPRSSRSECQRTRCATRMRRTLQRAHELHLGHDAVVEFLHGTRSEVPDHYREADPMELSIPTARQWLIHGSADDEVPVAFSRDYVSIKQSRSGKEKEDVHLLEIPDAGHFDIIDPRSTAWKQVEEIVLRLTE